MHPITSPKALSREHAHNGAQSGWRLFWIAVLGTALLVMQSLSAAARPESLAPLAEKVSPAVVNITTSTVVERGPTFSNSISPKKSPAPRLNSGMLVPSTCLSTCTSPRPMR